MCVFGEVNLTAVPYAFYSLVANDSNFLGGVPASGFSQGGHSNLTDANIGVFGYLKSGDILINDSGVHTNLTGPRISLLGFLNETTAQPFNKTHTNISDSAIAALGYVKDGDIIINGTTDHTNLTGPDITALGFLNETTVQPFNKTHTNRTDVEIRTIALEFNETLLIEIVNANHTVDTDTVYSADNHSVFINGTQFQLNWTTAKRDLNYSGEGNCTVSGSCGLIVYDGDIVINNSGLHTNLTGPRITALGFLNGTTAQPFNQTLTNLSDSDIAAFGYVKDGEIIINNTSPHTNISGPGITAFGFLNGTSAQPFNKTHTNISGLGISSLGFLNGTTAQPFNKTHTNRTDVEIIGLAQPMNNTLFIEIVNRNHTGITLYHYH